jgi:ketosteroid isomerase-like protein
MSQENLEIVQRALEHYNETGSVPWDLVDPEIEWVIDPTAWVAGTYRGHDGVRTLFSRMAEAFDRFQIEVERFVDAGDAVVVLGRSKVHGELSGVTTGQPLDQVFRVRARRITAVRAYLRREDALEAAGLRE